MSEEKKPIYKKWWFWLIIVVVVFAVAGVAMGGGNDEPAKVGESGSTTGSTEQTDPTSKEFAVGDVVAFDGKEITITNVVRNYDTGNPYYQPDSGNEFVKVSVKIDNKSDNKLSYNSYDWEIQDTNGDIKDADAGLQFTVDGALDSGELAPGGTKSADLYFQVPAGDAGLVLHYKSSLWDDKTVNIKL